MAMAPGLLTPREQEILDHIVSGRPNKEIARLLGTSGRTVEIQRASLMQKMGARNTADLVRIALIG